VKIPHEKFCVLPWISLEASPVGTVRPCCLAEEEIVDGQNKKFNLRQADFSEIQNSKYMTKLRRDFLQGKKPATCRKCWNEERAGRTSKRMHTLDRLKHMVQDASWTEDAKPLLFLDLKLGNICNLKCRICGSWSSSQFAVEELHFLGPEHKKQSHHYHMLKQGAWPRESPQFWNEIDRVLDQIRYIEFTGGEPFMIEEHFEMLRGIRDRGIAHQVEIHYNTNGTQWPESAEEIWQHFKTVEVAFSIDDVGDRFEYQRTNAVWNEVVENIAKFRSLRDRHSNIRLQVCSTVNVFNVLNLDALAAWIDQQAFDFVYWNMLHEPYYFSVATMPEEVKIVAIDQLESSEVGAPHRDEFRRIADFVSNGASLDGNILRMKITDLDRKRQQNLQSVDPQLARLIGYEPAKD
jgi:MoaA/NifB/PqqE/SkfB family radical SAM enzyme